MAPEFETYDEEYEHIYGNSVMDCPFCKGKKTMHYENNAYFVCEKCHGMIDREAYFYETHGYYLEMEDDEDFDSDMIEDY